MITQQNLDVRTVTLGLSLSGCADSDIDVMARRVYDRVTRAAERLVPVAEQIEREYGIPIVNKRISVTPIAQLAAAAPTPRTSRRSRSRSTAPRTRSASTSSAGSRRWCTRASATATGGSSHSIPEALAAHRARLRIGQRRHHARRHQHGRRAADGRRRSARTAELTADRDCIGCAKLVVFANMVEDNPFMAGAVHGTGEPDEVINVGISGPGVVRAIVDALPKDADLTAIAEAIKATSFKITRVGELVAREAAQPSGRDDGHRRPLARPHARRGRLRRRDHRGDGRRALRRPGHHRRARAAQRRGQEGRRDGHVAPSAACPAPSSPSREDQGMIRAAESGALTIEKLEAMTSVCSVGLDMIAIPGDTTAETIAGIIADECAIGVINSKTTAVRLIPAIGKSVGDRLTFGGLLGEAPVMAVNQWAGTVFARRGGRFPAPLQSLRN